MSVYCIGRTDQLPFTCGSRVLPIAWHTELGKIPTFIAEETVLLLPFVFIKKLVRPQLEVQSSSAGREHGERRVPGVGSSWARSSADAWGSKRPPILSLFLSVNFFFVLSPVVCICLKNFDSPHGWLLLSLHGSWPKPQLSSF